MQYYYHKETGYVPLTTAAYELAKKDGHYERTPARPKSVIQQLIAAGWRVVQGLPHGLLRRRSVT